jgi:hypothetical protein
MSGQNHAVHVRNAAARAEYPISLQYKDDLKCRRCLRNGNYIFAFSLRQVMQHVFCSSVH